MCIYIICIRNCILIRLGQLNFLKGGMETNLFLQGIPFSSVPMSNLFQEVNDAWKPTDTGISNIPKLQLGIARRVYELKSNCNPLRRGRGPF